MASNTTSLNPAVPCGRTGYLIGSVLPLEGKVAGRTPTDYDKGRLALVIEGRQASTESTLTRMDSASLGRDKHGQDITMLALLNPDVTPGQVILDVDGVRWIATHASTQAGVRVRSASDPDQHKSRWLENVRRGHSIPFWFEAAPLNPTATDVPEVEPVEVLTHDQWQAKWDALWEALNIEAQNQDWCSQYDDFADQHGGPKRTPVWAVHVEMSTGIEQGTASNVRDLLITKEKIDSIRSHVVTGQSIKHRRWVQVKHPRTDNMLGGEMLRETERVAREEGFIFDSLSIVEFDKA